MRIESVTAAAFGPLRDAKLTLAPGLTVVHGDNESAKSSWHAAIYAGLCGRRRGPGAGTKEDREFAALRRPWDAAQWQVSCRVLLDDGRRVELSHDLEGRVDCSAIELPRGRDVSAAIQYDGAPDGSRWLGLNRKTFAATACVNQGDMLSVLRAASDLQEDLQRAAATAGTDATAAKAIDALEDFHGQQVGLDRRNATKPLRRAKLALEAALGAQEVARSAHADYLRLVVQAEQAKAAADAAERQRRGGERTLADAETLLAAVRDARAAASAADQAQARARELARRAAEQRRRLEQAARLAALFPDGEPGDARSDDDLARQVTQALAAWQAAPAVQALSGPTADQLRDQLAAVPQPPDGDIEPDPSIRALLSRCHEARAVLAATKTRRPDQPVDISAELPAQLLAARHSAADARALAQAELAEAESAQADAESRWGQTSLEARRRPATSPRSTRATVAVAAGVLLGIAGLVCMVLGRPLAGAAALVLAAAAAAVGALLRGPAARHHPGASDTVDAGRALDAARERVSAGHRGLLEAERAYAAADARVEAAERQAAEARAEVARWERDHDEAASAATAAEQRLRQALERRGCVAADVETAYECYERQCADRRSQAEESRRRLPLQRRVEERAEAERIAAQATRTRRAAVQGVLAAARAAGLTDPGLDAGEAPTEDVDALSQDLQAWLDVRATSARKAEERRAAWQQLQTLLDGATLGELRHAVAADSGAADEARAGAESLARAAERARERRDSAARLAGVELPPDDVAAEELVRAAVADRRGSYAQAVATAAESASRAAEAEGAARERARCLPDVAAAEEAVERARQELRRVEQLGATLQLTREYLTAAQQRVHEEIAPMLVETLDRWLPAVTAGRYSRSAVEPTTLEVKVAPEQGTWRKAHQLSVGTAEQVYLLLRVALAQHLSDKGTVCPLLLDDVTVQADPRRTAAILATCLALAEAGRQVVLFAQEPTVAQWAEEHLSEPRHKLVRLDVVPVS